MTDSSTFPLVAPFRGERYAAHDRLSELIAPPYDVISDGERAALAERHEHNIVHLILPAADGDRYQAAARTLERWRTGGVLARDAHPGLLVLQQEFHDQSGVARTRTGLIGAVAVEPFEGGRVRPHERTHRGPKEDRLALLRATRVMGEALLMLSRDRSGQLARELARVTAHPSDGTARLNEVDIRVWRIAAGAADRLARVAGAEPLYIADGHHRYETALAFRSEHPAASRTLSLIVSLQDPGLVVLPTHRLVHAGSVAQDELRDRLAENFVVESIPERPDARRTLHQLGRGCVLVVSENHRLALRLRDSAAVQAAEPTPPLRNLDVGWADRLILPVLRGPGDAGRVTYSSDPEEVIETVRQRRASAGMLLNPPAVEDVLAVADAGAVMPQKSTFFFPKVPSGVVLLDYARSSGSPL